MLRSNFIIRIFFIILMLHTAILYGATDKIIVFGDSLSDNGNFYSSTFRLIPKSPPYYKGRFSNGLTWVENLAVAMHLNPESKDQLADFAYGGAKAETDKNDIAWQVHAYLEKSINDHEKDKHLFVIWIGNNDYLTGRGDLENLTTNTIASIQKHMEILIKNGAKNLLILNLPDLGQTPLARLAGLDYASIVSQMVRLHNAKLRAMLAHEKAKYAGVKFIFYDVTHYFQDAIAHPAKYGIKNSKDACYEGDAFMFTVLDDPKFASYKERVSNTGAIVYCGDADEHLFWDHVHPTRVVHQRIAEAVFAQLKTYI